MAFHQGIALIWRTTTMKNVTNAAGTEGHYQQTRDGARKGIDKIDTALLKLLAKRHALSKDMSRLKADGEIHFRDQQREESILVRLVQQGRKHDLDANYITRIFHTIFHDSLRTQQRYLQALATAYLQLHNAKPGCFAARVTRA